MQLTVRERVAQHFFLGTDSENPEGMLQPFTRTGLGGFLGFRQHFQRFSHAYDLRDWLTHFQSQFKGAGLTYIALDEEGGQVSRLPHWLFPVGCNAIHLGLKNNNYLVERIAKEQSQRLHWLGFNLNFVPVLDCNTQVANPIIGVRSYGDNPQVIAQCAKVVFNAYWQNGVFAVGKHFPGHGSGTVDSHIALPIFDNWQPEELLPFESLMAENIPGILTAHGLYPKLQKEFNDSDNMPASLSYTLTTQLLKEKMHFGGLVFTDDLSMGALAEYGDPSELAFNALHAGADLLVWRMCSENAEGIYEAFEHIVKSYQNGKLSEFQLDKTVSKILHAKQFMAKQPKYDYPEAAWTQEACHQQSLQWHLETTLELKHHFPSPLPLTPFSLWGIVAPDPVKMIHYQWDYCPNNTLRYWAKQYNLEPLVNHYYDPIQTNSLPEDTFINKTLDTIVFIGFNSLLCPQQQHYYSQLQQAHPMAKIILVSVGMPTDGDILPNAWAHLALPSYRPAALETLFRWLTA